jgi:uncharacterized protein YqeY
MSYLERLTGDMKAAMKARAPERVLVLRMLINGIKEQQSKLGRDDLEEDEELSVLQKAVKTRRDSVAQAEKVGRRDVAEREQAEIAIVQAYLPEMMPPEELAAKVGELAGEIGYGGPKDTGRFMREWMSRYKGLAEGRDVQALLKEL